MNTSLSLPSWGISLTINLAVLGALAFVTNTIPIKDGIGEFTASVDPVDNAPSYTFTDAAAYGPAGQDGDGSGGSFGNGPPSTLAALGSESPQTSPTTAATNVVSRSVVPDISRAAILQPTKNVSLTDHQPVKGGGGLTVSGGAKGAMDRLTHEIRLSLQDKKTLVIWLFDASASLKERRDVIASRFENVYNQLTQMGDTKGLMTAAADFGQDFHWIAAEPVDDVQKLLEPVRKIKVDETGRENTFQAVKNCVDKFGHWKPAEHWSKMIIIVTDEKGDDAAQASKDGRRDLLDDVINSAKQSKIKVFCVGNAAVFGREKGYINYRFEDGYEQPIEVDQGPETAFPDAIALPFFGSNSDNFKLQQMSASYGPYALTRLCSETQGNYLITQDSLGYHFDPAAMRQYAPDYNPIRTQEEQIRKNAAKSALVEAARMAPQLALNVPQTKFRAYNDNMLRGELTEAQKPVAVVEFDLDRLWKVLEAGEKARTTLKEPRWQAAFDLAMGRTLAMKARYDGYKAMLANMRVNPKTFQKDDSNEWNLVPSAQPDAGPQIRKLVEQARTYLKRVIDDHPGTPWAFLAEKELSTEMGWTWKESGRPVPGMKEGKARGEQVARLLLAEDDDKKKKQQAKPQQMEKQRVLPKL